MPLSPSQQSNPASTPKKRPSPSNHSKTPPPPSKRPRRTPHTYAHSALDPATPAPPPRQTRKYCVTFEDEEATRQQWYTTAHPHPPHLKPVRMHIKDFTKRHFEEFLVHGRQPVILTGACEKREEEAWRPRPMISVSPRKSQGNSQDGPKPQRRTQSTPEKRKREKDCVYVPVRYQAVEDGNNDRRYCPLKDDIKPLGWVLKHGGQSKPGVDPEHEGREGLRTVMYVKDWDFGATHPHWFTQLREELPRFLWWHNINDSHGYLPPSARVRNLVAYMGFDGSRTPLHVDKVYNIAVNVAVHGTGRKHWRVIADESVVMLKEELRRVGGSIFAEDFWVSSEFLDALPIHQYVFDQNPHEVVLVPPDMPHQVLNVGSGYSLALAYNILHPLHLAHAVRIDRLNQRHCYPSLYRVKAMVYHGVITECKRIRSDCFPTGLSRKQCIQRVRVALEVLAEIVAEEEDAESGAAAALASFRDIDDVRYQRTCDVCRTDLFNRRISCRSCSDTGFDLCVSCFQRCHRQHRLRTLHPHPLSMFERYTISQLERLMEQGVSLLRRTLNAQ